MSRRRHVLFSMFLRTLVIVLASLIASAESVGQSDSMSIAELVEALDKPSAGNKPELLCPVRLSLADKLLLEENDPVNAAIHYRQVYRLCSSNMTEESHQGAVMRLAVLSGCEEYYLDALNMLEELVDTAWEKGDTLWHSIFLNLIGDTYLAMGNEPAAKKVLDSIRTNLGTSTHRLLHKVNSNSVTAMVRNGVPFQNLLDRDSIESSITPALTKRQYNGVLELNAAIVFKYLQELQLANYYLHRTLTSETDAVIVRDANLELALLHEDQGNYELALAYTRAYADLNDALLSARRQEMISRLRIQLETYKHRGEISELERERNIQGIRMRLQRVGFISVLVASIIVLFGTYLTIRNYQKRLTANQIIHQQTEEIDKQRITDLENNLKIESMHSMIEGQEAERERIARELHDSLGGLLSTIKLHFDVLQTQDESVREMAPYTKAYSLIDQACNEVRSISNNMQPGALLRLGVVPAINDLVNRLQGQETPRIDFQHFDVQESFEQSKALNIYRIVQELVNNSIKHAQAAQILVQLVQKENELFITVEDDGIGYDPDRAKRGMGTGNIASRVNFLKGDIHVHSVAGEGTSTLITLTV